MCRNIKTLFNFEPPATKAEIRDASLQFVRKLSGFTQTVQSERSGVRTRDRGDRGVCRDLDRLTRHERAVAHP